MATIGCLLLMISGVARYYFFLGAQKVEKKSNTQYNHVVVHFRHVFPAWSPLFTNSKDGVNRRPRVRHETQSSSVCVSRARTVLWKQK